jgi:hypothetical protein
VDGQIAVICLCGSSAEVSRAIHMYRRNHSAPRNFCCAAGVFTSGTTDSENRRALHVALSDKLILVGCWKTLSYG